MKLALKSASIITLIVGLSLALIGMLNLFKFEQTLRSTIDTRLGFVADDLVAQIQTGLDLGLGLPSMSNVQQILDREAAMDANIFSIDVFGDRGTVLFSTNRDSVGEPVSPEWVNEIEMAEGGPWQTEGRESLVVGRALTSNFGFEVGGVALRYSAEEFRAKIDEMRGLLVRVGLITLVITAPCAFLFSILFFGRTARSLDSVHDALKATLTEPEKSAYAPGRDPIEQEYAEVDAQIRRSLGQRPAGNHSG